MSTITELFAPLLSIAKGLWESAGPSLGEASSQASTLLSFWAEVDTLLRPWPFRRVPHPRARAPHCYVPGVRMLRYEGGERLWRFGVGCAAQTALQITAEFAGLKWLPFIANVCPRLPWVPDIWPRGWPFSIFPWPRQTLGSAVAARLRDVLHGVGYSPRTPSWLSLRDSPKAQAARAEAMEAFYRDHCGRVCSRSAMRAAGRPYTVFELRPTRAHGVDPSPIPGVGLLTTPGWGTSLADDPVRENKRGQAFHRKWRDLPVGNPWTLRRALEAEVNAASLGVLRGDPKVDRQLFSSPRFRSLHGLREAKMPYFVDNSDQGRWRSLKAEISQAGLSTKANWGALRPSLGADLCLRSSPGNNYGVAGWRNGPSPEARGLVYHWTPWSGLWVGPDSPHRTVAHLIPRGLYYDRKWWPEEADRLGAQVHRRWRDAWDTNNTRVLTGWPFSLVGGPIDRSDVRDGAEEAMAEDRDRRGVRVAQYRKWGQAAYDLTLKQRVQECHLEDPTLADEVWARLDANEPAQWARRDQHAAERVRKKQVHGDTLLWRSQTSEREVVRSQRDYADRGLITRNQHWAQESLARGGEVFTLWGNSAERAAWEGRAGRLGLPLWDYLPQGFGESPSVRGGRDNILMRGPALFRSIERTLLSPAYCEEERVLEAERDLRWAREQALAQTARREAEARLREEGEPSPNDSLHTGFNGSPNRTLIVEEHANKGGQGSPGSSHGPSPEDALNVAFIHDDNGGLTQGSPHDTSLEDALNLAFIHDDDGGLKQGSLDQTFSLKELLEGSPKGGAHTGAKGTGGDSHPLSGSPLYDPLLHDPLMESGGAGSTGAKGTTGDSCPRSGPPLREPLPYGPFEESRGEEGRGRGAGRKGAKGTGGDSRSRSNSLTWDALIEGRGRGAGRRGAKGTGGDSRSRSSSPTPDALIEGRGRGAGRKGAKGTGGDSRPRGSSPTPDALSEGRGRGAGRKGAKGTGGDSRSRSSSPTPDALSEGRGRGAGRKGAKGTGGDSRSRSSSPTPDALSEGRGRGAGRKGAKGTGGDSRSRSSSPTPDALIEGQGRGVRGRKGAKGAGHSSPSPNVTAIAEDKETGRKGSKGSSRPPRKRK